MIRGLHSFSGSPGKITTQNGQNDRMAALAKSIVVAPRKFAYVVPPARVEGRVAMQLATFKHLRA
jgi:hypothetical protein